jgi:hypothetical protein
MKNWKKFGLLLFFVQLQLSVFAQIDNTSLENNFLSNQSNTRGVYFRMYNFNYMRNYEYFNKFADGLTYFGNILQPEFTFVQSPNLSMSAGVNIRKDYGSKGFYATQPILRIDYHRDNIRIINGALNGNVSHRLPEPIYNYDRIITDNIEYGTQFILENANSNLDVWLNWENMIYKISPNQEIISGGVHYQKNLYKKGNLSVAAPIDFLVFHKGGQIDTPDRPLISILNSSFGLTLSYVFSKATLHSENYLITYKDFSFVKQNKYLQGQGLYLNLGVKTKMADFILSYWQGEGFQSTHGAPIFSSVSSQINNNGFHQDERSLLFFRIISEFPISENFSISSRIEPYIDLNNPAFEFSNSLFLTYRENFSLTKK